MSANLDEPLKFFWDTTKRVLGISILLKVAAKLPWNRLKATPSVGSREVGRTQLVAQGALIR